MVERSVEGPSGALNFIWLCTAEVARRTLSVDIGARLECSVHPRDQTDLILNGLEWSHGGGEFCQRSIAKVWILFPKRRHHIPEITLWDDMIRFTGKKPRRTTPIGT